MPTQELLDLIPMLNRLSFLKGDSPLTNSVVDKLSTDGVTNVHPAQVFIIKKVSHFSHLHFTFHNYGRQNGI